MKYFDEDGDEMSEENFTYLQNMEMHNSEQFKHDIFINGQLNKNKYLDEIRFVKQNIPVIDGEIVKNIFCETNKLINYKSKIDFLKENNLCPLEGVYSFKIDDDKLEFLSFTPINEREERLFFEYLVSWFNETLSSNKDLYGYDFHSLEELKNSIEKEEAITKDLLNRKFKENRNRLINYSSDEQWFTNDFINHKRNSDKGTIKDMFNPKNLSSEELVITAYLVAPVYGYLEFEKYLNEKISNNEYDDILQNETDEYRISKTKSFRSLFTKKQLEELSESLVKEEMIVSDDKNKFILMFSEVKISKTSFIWYDKRSGGVNWQSLFKIIEKVCKPDFNRYKNEIIEIVGNSILDSNEKSVYERLKKSYDQIIIDLNNDSEGSKNVEKILDQIS